MSEPYIIKQFFVILFSMNVSLFSIWNFNEAIRVKMPAGICSISGISSIISVIAVRHILLMEYTDRTYSDFIYRLIFAKPQSLLMLFLVILLIEIYCFCQNRRKAVNIITYDSIKESLDNLPSGICFSDSNGTPLLINHTMHKIAYQTFGEMVLNIEECRKKIKNGNVSKNVSLIRSNEENIIKTDTAIWNIKETIHGDILETIALDITEEFHLTDEITVQNQRLNDMNKKMREYAKKRNQYIAEKENLEAKIRVHDNIGRSLIAFRYYLESSDKDKDTLFKIWKNSIILNKNEALFYEPDEWQNLLLASKNVGVNISIDGYMPENDELKHITINILLEALNNAVRHAKGNNLYVSINENSNAYFIKIKNDGIQPKEQIKEKGGLKNLRENITLLGGAFDVIHSPCFEMKIELPKAFDNYKKTV